MNPNTPEPLLQELLGRLGLPDILPDEDGAYGVVFDDDLAITCRATPGGVRFESRVCVLPADGLKRDEMLALLLGECAAVMREQASVLHLDTHGVAVLLYRITTPGSLDARLIREALDEFLASLSHWRARAEGLTGDAGVRCVRPSPFMVGTMRLEP